MSRQQHHRWKPISLEQRDRRRGGFTLIELLLVMGLIALLLGIGVGAFARLDFGDRVASSLVENVLRSAHNWAVARDAPARVTIDRATRTIRSEGLQVIGTWHFETLPIEGAFGLSGAHFGGQLVDDGFQGRAISFLGEPSRSRVEFPVNTDPSFDLREGFAIGCAVRVGAGRSGAVLRAGESVSLDVAPDGSIHGWVVGQLTDELGQEQRGGRIPIASPPHVVTPGRWTQIELSYDRKKLRLFADAAPVAEVAETVPVWRLQGPLVLSPDPTPFPGAIDNLVVSAVVAQDETVLPMNTGFAANVPTEILFAAGGGLDRNVHSEPVRVTVESEDNAPKTLVVSLFGTVE